MRVTSIVPIDKRKSKVFFDEGFALAFYKGEIAKFHLEEECQVEEAQYQEMLAVLCRRARERALYLLKSCDRTEQEIRRKLKEGLYPQEAIEQTLEFLREYGFVDDQSYGRRYLDTYKGSRSRKRIQYDLKKKGLSGEQIEELLEEQPVEEEAQIRRYLEKKGYLDRELTFEERKKAASSLIRKGFSYEAVYGALGN